MSGNLALLSKEDYMEILKERKISIMHGEISLKLGYWASFKEKSILLLNQSTNRFRVSIQDIKYEDIKFDFETSDI